MKKKKMDINPIRLGQLIKTKRVEKDFSVRKLAKSVEVSGGYITQIEKGRYPSEDVVMKLFDVLDIDEQTINNFEKNDRIKKSYINDFLSELDNMGEEKVEAYITFFRQYSDIMEKIIEIEKYEKRNGQSTSSIREYINFLHDKNVSKNSKEVK